MQNKYDEDSFFEKYSQMDRSKKGLEGAGEWETLQKMLPDFNGKRVLDLGCGYGWHCRYAKEHGAKTVVGVDISQKMLEKAKTFSPDLKITYLNSPIEQVDFPEAAFDIVISSLTFHYLPHFTDIVKKVYSLLDNNGYFIFSVEHPIFTAYGTQDWVYDENGTILYFPIDNYFMEGERKAIFLGEEVIKYHKTLTTYLNELLQNGFIITEFQEPTPPKHLLTAVPGMKDELRRPMMLLISAQKH